MFRQLAGLERWAVLILQLFLGFVFVMHGSQKLFGAFGGAGVAGLAGMFQKYALAPALFWAWVVTITEFFGGLCIFFGFLTRFWAAGLVIDMTVAVLRVHVPNGFFWGKGGLEFPLTLGILALMVVLTGPSFLSVDRLIGLEKRRD
jgi:putative oxidoreductase